MLGTVVGFTSIDGELIGRNTTGKYYDCFHLRGDGKPTVGPGWCGVKWDTGKECIYPIGSPSYMLSWWYGSSGEASHSIEWQQEINEAARCCPLEYLIGA